MHKKKEKGKQISQIAAACIRDQRLRSTSYPDLRQDSFALESKLHRFPKGICFCHGVRKVNSASFDAGCRCLEVESATEEFNHRAQACLLRVDRGIHYLPIYAIYAGIYAGTTVRCTRSGAAGSVL